MKPAAAEHQRLILRVAMAPRGEKQARTQELRAWVRAQLRHDVGLGPEFVWWPIGKPLPPGSKLARQQASHHHQYSQLIVVGGA